jgi:hypothetical protein
MCLLSEVIQGAAFAKPLLQEHGYLAVPSESFDRERAIFPQTALAFIQETQPTEWARHLDSVQNVHAFLERVNRIATEVSGTLLKLGKVLD